MHVHTPTPWCSAECPAVRSCRSFRQARIAELEGQLVQTQDVAWQFPIIVWALVGTT